MSLKSTNNDFWNRLQKKPAEDIYAEVKKRYVGNASGIIDLLASELYGDVNTVDSNKKVYDIALAAFMEMALEKPQAVTPVVESSGIKYINGEGPDEAGRIYLDIPYDDAAILQRLDDLESTVVYQGDNISILVNDAGYITINDIPAHILAITITDIANWNEAYSWGDHSLIGYLTDAPSDGNSYVRKNGAWVIQVDLGDKNYVHNQVSANSVWTINHNLGKTPTVKFVDESGNQRYPARTEFPSINQAVAYWSIAVTGTAIMN